MKLKLTTKFNKDEYDGVWQNITDSFNQNLFPDKEKLEASIHEADFTIKGVCVFGTKESKNGYVYSDKAVNTLTRMAHGAKLFLNHPGVSELKERDGVRDIRHWAGVFLNPRREGDKVMADLKVRESYWPLVKDVAMLQPQGVGNSINSRVKIFQDDKGKESIVDIESLNSIDLVANAATTSNLFESVPEDTLENQLDDLTSFADKGMVQISKNARETIEIRDFAKAKMFQITEGILKDKIKEKEIRREIDRLQWDAWDVISDILQDGKKKFPLKKEEIGEVLEDLESMINKALKATPKTENKNSNNDLDNQEVNEDMDLTKLTLEELAKARPDLMGEIKTIAENEVKSSN